MNPNISKSIAIARRVLPTVVSLLLLLLILLHLPVVQQWGKDQAVTYLQKKIKTPVKIQSISFGLFKPLQFEGVYLEDQKKDTLLAAQKIEIDYGLSDLFRNQLTLNTISLKGITIKIDRSAQGKFNFDYLIEAFTNKEESDTTSSAMPIVLRSIELDQIKLTYQDRQNPLKVQLLLKKGSTQFKTFDLENQKMSIPSITINGLTTSILQNNIPKSKSIATNAVVNPTPSSSTSTWKIQLGQVDLKRFQADYEEQSQKIKTQWSFRKWLTVFELLDLTNQLVVIQKMEFENLRGSVTKSKNTLKIQPIAGQPTTSTSKGWEVKLNTLNVPELFFQWDDQNYPNLKKGLDYNHIQLNNAKIILSNLHYRPESLTAIIRDCGFREKSGLKLQKASAELFYGSRNSYVKNLLIETPFTKIKQQLELGYSSSNSLIKHPEVTKIKAKTNESSIGFNDVLLLAPQLSETPPFKDNPKGKLEFQSTIEGSLNDLVFQQVRLSGIGKTRLQASGRLIGLPKTNSMRFDWTINELQTTSQDITELAPKGIVPNSIQLPKLMTVKGQLAGTLQQIKTDLTLNSSFGKAKMKGTLDQSKKNNPEYQMQAELFQFDIGKFLKNKSLGKIATKAQIKGRGFDPKTAKISGSGSLEQFPFNGYNYKNSQWSAMSQNGQIEAYLESKDPNFNFQLSASGNIQSKTPNGKAQLKIANIDLEKLKWYTDPLQIKGNIFMDFQALDIDKPNGRLWTEDLEMTNEKGLFPIDPIQVITKSSIDSTQLLLNSSIVEASLKGNFQWSQLPLALKHTLANYYQATPYLRRTKIQPQEFTLKVSTKESPLFTQILPELKEVQPIVLEGKYNSVSDDIQINAFVPKIVYGSQTLTNASLALNKKDKDLHYQLEIDDIQNPQMQLPYTLLSGKIANNQIDYDLLIKDQKDVERYHLAGIALADKRNTIIHLLPEAFRLNYDQWKLPEDNRITLSSKGITISQFKIEHEGSSVSIQSETLQPNAPIAIAFENFAINTLTDLVEKDDWKMGGTLNGPILLKNWTTTPLFTSDIRIDNFSFQNELLGDCSMKVANNQKEDYEVQLGLIGDNADVQLQGIYAPVRNELDMLMDINKLNMKSIQAFTLGQLTESSGFLTGHYTIAGKASFPIVTGRMKFNDVGFKVKFLNAKFQSINDAIAFEDRKIIFDNFTIKDEKSNNLIVDGPIDMNNWNKIGFDLTIDAQNFKAVNATAKDNELFYGELYLDNKLNIKGSSKSPKISGAVKVNKDTRFTIVVPQSDPSIADREGIVEFIDPNQANVSTTVISTEQLNQSEVTGVNASVDIAIDKEAELTLIIDKATGDFVKAKGTANLNGGIDDSGKTTLTGKYELEEGVYEMTFSGIKRKFDIKKGSYILWKGEPMSADINITAIYNVTTAPIDLVENQIRSSSEAERNTFKEKIPFETQLNITGELLKPEISFDIELPDNNSVSSKIINTTKARLDQLREDPNEMNKQVFSLLVLGNFMGENPLSSESGISASSMAKNSASKILSNQLNSLAGDLIKGIDLNFNLQNTEDYSTGKKEEKTDLNIGISKKLFNDRLKVTVGSSFGLEGNMQANERASNIAGDVSIDYQITKDGRYKVRGYRVNKYQVALQGEVVETGVSFIITMDYNRFKELFSKSK